MLTPVDIKNLKLPSSSDGSKKELMDKLQNSLQDKEDAFTRLVGSTSKTGLYPEGLKKSIQDAGPLAAITEAAKAGIMQEYSIYASLMLKKMY